MRYIPFLLTIPLLAALGCGNNSDPKEDTDVPVIVFEDPECVSDAECVGAANGPVCDLSSETCVAECVSDDECADPARPVCDLDAKACVGAPAGSLIGQGDGSASSVEFVKVYEPSAALEAPDLEFHQTRNELWVLNRRFEVEGVCAQANPSSARCQSLGGLTTIITDPGTPEQEVKILEDANSWHFMRRPPAMAMGDMGLFATCGEANTANYEDDPAQFIGPTLWSSNRRTYAQPSGGNGSHMDMLHASAYCMGIAHERENVYWVFNGDKGSVDRYDFHDDHGPGQHDHSDGEIFRYVPGEVKRVPNVPSHMEFHDADAHLYIVDTGNARVIKLDTESGDMGGRFQPVYEPLASWGFMNDAVVTPVITSGDLVSPSGLAIHEDTIYISDHATSTLYAFDMQGTMLRSLKTDLPEGSLAGITVGPDYRLWFTDMKTGAVYTIRPKAR